MVALKYSADDGSSTQTSSYTYDNQNQMTQETTGGVTKTYTYDTAGNIQKITSGNTVLKSFTYDQDNTGWKDRLTQVTVGNTTKNITYESCEEGYISGNPIEYFNGTQWDFSWSNGRQLTQATSGDDTLSFTYGVDDIRTSKTVNGVTYEYMNLNGRVARQSWTEDGVFHRIDFIYDQQGKPLTLRYKVGDTSYTYYCLTNLQGDVLKLYQAAMVDGKLVTTEVASYTYDAWGNVTDITRTAADTQDIAHLNPIRYRGYYQDIETGFYYLESRYYDPAIGRFVNADAAEYTALSVGSFSDTNLFAYCGNNPVVRKDDGGEFWNIIVGAVVGGGLELAGQLLSGKSLSDVNWTKVGVSALSGGLTAAVGPVAGCLVSGATDVTMDALDGKINSLGDAVKSFAWGTAKAAVSYRVGTAVGKATNSLTKTEKIGRLGKEGYPGIKYSYNKGRNGNRAIRSIELHPRHNKHGIHLQGNKWNPRTGTRSGAFFRLTLWR